MGKLIIFRLENGNFDNGFPVTLQISEDNTETITHPQITVRGDLPPLPYIAENYQNWQESYRSLSHQARLGASIGQITNVSLDCNKHGNNIKQQLKEWYNSSGIAKIRAELLAEVDKNEEIRVLVQTQNLSLRRLPWHIFFEDFLSKYLRAEVALSPVEYTTLNIKGGDRHQIRILAILGNSEGIDIKPDQQIIESLSNAETLFLLNPNRHTIIQHLYEQNWDILFFAGHSNFHEAGKFEINNQESITITELENALKTAINNGLRLAIFNSCNGLGLAQALEKLHLAQIIVMRENIPDRIAQVFLKEFLTSFAQGKSLYFSVRQARERLQDYEKEYPYASWLPVICQNPGTIPLTWQSLLGLKPMVAQPPLVMINPEKLNQILLIKSINQATFTVEYNPIQKIEADVLVSYDDVNLSMSNEVAASLRRVGGDDIEYEAKRRRPQQLGKVAETTGGDLLAKYLFHAVIFDDEQPGATNIELIRKVTRRCLNLAEEREIFSLAFPALTINIAQLAPEQVATAMMIEVVRFLAGATTLKKVTIAIYGRKYKDRYIIDDSVARFYTQVSNFLDLHLSMEIRRSLLRDLTKVYQTRQMWATINILQSYEHKLDEIQEDFLRDVLASEIDKSSVSVNNNYHQSITTVGDRVEIAPVMPEESLLITNSETGANLWEKLQSATTETEFFELLESVNLDVDALAWVNDQYEVAIASLEGKTKRLKDILDEQLQEIKYSQNLLHRHLLKWFQEGKIPPKILGNERKLAFQSYPKIELKVKPEELPVEYRQEKVSYTANKTELKKAESEGVDVSEWAEIAPNYKVKFGFLKLKNN